MISNEGNEDIASGKGCRVTVRVVPTSDNPMVARYARRPITRKE